MCPAVFSLQLPNLSCNKLNGKLYGHFSEQKINFFYWMVQIKDTNVSIFNKLYDTFDISYRTTEPRCDTLIHGR